MAKQTIPKLIYGILLMLHVLFIALTLSTLPDPIATHFNSANLPDDWSSHQTYWLIQVLVSIVTPMFVVFLLSFTNRLPSYLVNLPNKDYWLHPDRQESTQQRIVIYGWWMACIIVIFSIGLHYGIWMANQQALPRIDGDLMFHMTMGFIVLTIIWAMSLVRSFKVPGAR